MIILLIRCKFAFLICDRPRQLSSFPPAQRIWCVSKTGNVQLSSCVDAAGQKLKTYHIPPLNPRYAILPTDSSLLYAPSCGSGSSTKPDLGWSRYSDRRISRQAFTATGLTACMLAACRLVSRGVSIGVDCCSLWAQLECLGIEGIKS